MNKMMVAIAVVAMGMMAVAQEQGPKPEMGPKPEQCPEVGSARRADRPHGPEMGDPRMHGPKPVELVLCPKTLTPEAVEQYKKDVCERIDKAVAHAMEMKDKAPKCLKPECKDECKCGEKCECPKMDKMEPAKLVLLETRGGRGPMMGRPGEGRGPQHDGKRPEMHGDRPEMHGDRPEVGSARRADRPHGPEMGPMPEGPKPEEAK